MAGRGPAPKPASQRRNRTAPQRGEWVDLEPLEKPVLPELPAMDGGDWSGRTRAAWEAWRADPATGMFGPAEIAAAVELAFVMEDYVRGDEKAAEVRLRMDGLGLSAKGKRDLRWRPPTERQAEESSRRPQLAEVRRLRAVDAAS